MNIQHSMLAASCKLNVPGGQQTPEKKQVVMTRVPRRKIIHTKFRWEGPSG